MRHLGIKWENWEGLLSFTGVERSAYKSRDSHKRSRRAAAHADGTCRREASPCLIPRENPNFSPWLLPPASPSWQLKRQSSSSISWLRCCWTHHSEQYRYGRDLNFKVIWADISILQVENTPRSKTSKMTWEFKHVNNQASQRWGRGIPPECIF